MGITEQTITIFCFLFCSANKNPVIKKTSFVMTLNQEITNPKFKDERRNIGRVWNGSFPFFLFILRPLKQLEQIRLQLCGIFLAWQIHRGVHGFGKQKLLKTPPSIFLDLHLNNKKACFTMMWPAPDSKWRVTPLRNTEFYYIDHTHLEASLALVFQSQSWKKLQSRLENKLECLRSNPEPETWKGILKVFKDVRR